MSNDPPLTKVNQKELRLALVCYGGVSLAVYMHGITKEIHKLVRASKAYHSGASTSEREQSLFAKRDRETDTEVAYLRLLETIGERLDLRVVVDVIAGASAGGINAVCLARSLAHDLPLDTHRSMWLDLADITELADSKLLANRWSKAYLKPFLWTLNRKRQDALASDREVALKLSTLMRSRWFSPPFSGERFSSMLLSALKSMGEPQTESLLPSGHRLDLFVTLTDFYGYGQSIALHDPPLIKEREHRHTLFYSYLEDSTGKVASDFTAKDLPALAFAARGTSSFAGAFPPLQVAEIDRVLKARGETWPNREAFLRAQFGAMFAAGEDPLSTSFIDGGVLNNKPFAAAIRSLRERPAHREVERRVVYVEPNPARAKPRPGGAPPSYFKTLRGAYSDILRNEPIRDELESLAEESARAKRLKHVIASARPGISLLVTRLIDDPATVPCDAGAIAGWRASINEHAAKMAGYAYASYAELKLVAVIDYVAKILQTVEKNVGHPQEREARRRALALWAEERCVLGARSPTNDETLGITSAQIEFLRGFDVEYRTRRLRFVVRRVNELYLAHAQAATPDMTNDVLDALKCSLYELLDRLAGLSRGEQLSESLRARVPRLSRGGGLPELDTVFDELKHDLDLAGLDDATDRVFADLCAVKSFSPTYNEILVAYLGFAFFDVLTFPIVSSRQIDELDEIKVVRVSPDDAVSIRSGGAKACLKGIALNHFGAFFSRRARENDYLWGRLHAAERLVDIVVDAVGQAACDTVNVRETKRALFEAILRAEEPHLAQIADVFAEIREEIDA